MSNFNEPTRINRQAPDGRWITLTDGPPPPADLATVCTSCGSVDGLDGQDHGPVYLHLHHEPRALDDAAAAAGDVLAFCPRCLLMALSIHLGAAHVRAGGSLGDFAAVDAGTPTEPAPDPQTAGTGPVRECRRDPACDREDGHEPPCRSIDPALRDRVDTAVQHGYAHGLPATTDCGCGHSQARHSPAGCTVPECTCTLSHGNPF